VDENQALLLRKTAGFLKTDNWRKVSPTINWSGEVRSKENQPAHRGKTEALREERGKLGDQWEKVSQRREESEGKNGSQLGKARATLERNTRGGGLKKWGGKKIENNISSSTVSVEYGGSGVRDTERKEVGGAVGGCAEQGGGSGGATHRRKLRRSSAIRWDSGRAG